MCRKGPVAWTGKKTQGAGLWPCSGSPGSSQHRAACAQHRSIPPSPAGSGGLTTVAMSRTRDQSSHSFLCLKMNLPAKGRVRGAGVMWGTMDVGSYSLVEVVEIIEDDDSEVDTILAELQLSRHWMALVQVLVREPISTVTGSGGRTTSEFLKHWQGERKPGCFAVIPRFLVFGWKKQRAQNKVFLNHPEKSHLYYCLSCRGAAPPPHPTLPNRPGTLCNTITLQITPGSNFTEAGMRAS
uniref:Uncharacterized protein n=1 Tax=Cyanistes caeruleus TaxID=156563 RepID=A0A8C0U191_CYACU